VEVIILVDRERIEEKLCQLICDNVRILKTSAVIQKEIFTEIEQTMVALLKAHQPEPLITKQTASLLYGYPYEVEGEAPYSDQTDFLLAHCRMMEQYFGLLLAGVLPEDRPYGRIL
jgi:hypothetical protein